MGMHAVLYRSSQAIGATFASLSAIGFSQDVVTNNKILLQDNMELRLATLMGTGLASARIQTPLLLQTASNQLRPFNVATTWVNNPNTADFLEQPVGLRGGENIDVQTTNTDAGAQVHTALLQLGDRNYSLPVGQRLKIRATGATTVTAGAWTRVPLTYDDNLPNKLFAIVGMEVQSATGIIGRLDIPGQAYKPGVPVVDSLADRMYWAQYKPVWGELGRFRNTSLPALELFATAADTSQQVWLDIVVIG